MAKAAWSPALSISTRGRLCTRLSPSWCHAYRQRAVIVLDVERKLTVCLSLTKSEMKVSICFLRLAPGIKTSAHNAAQRRNRYTIELAIR
jgi:hypothetical protein